MPIPGKDENDCVKNFIDVYKVGSEEVRHSATIIWQFSLAILTFLTTAIYFAANKRDWVSFIVLGTVGVVGIQLSRLLYRQCLDRQDMVGRLKATEVSLRNSYQFSYAQIGGGPEHEFKSTALAKFLKGLSWTMLIVAILCVLGRGALAIHHHCSGKPVAPVIHR